MIMGFTKLTAAIEEKAIPLLLAGNDVMGAARIGRWMTLAFLTLAIDLLPRLKFHHPSS